MRHKNMYRLLSTVLLACFCSSAAMAASVTNSDDATVVLVVVESGNRMDIAIDAGDTQDICPAGCFITLPNGDRVALEGGETLEIVNGSLVVK